MTCWYCGTKEADPKKSIKLYMYGELLAADTEENKKRIAFSTKIVDVPRCADCKKAHTQSKMANLLLIVMGVLFLASLITALAGTWVAQWVWGLVMGLAIGAGFMLLVLQAFILKGVKKKAAAKKDFPQVVDLLCEGYKFGKNPSYEESISNGSTAIAKNKACPPEEPREEQPPV